MKLRGFLQSQKFFRSSLLIAGLCAVLVFQNCGKAGFDNEGMSSESATKQLDPKFASLPFPYDISFNQISYMSCPNTSGQTPGSPYFTFHLGAYVNAGTPAQGFGIRDSGLSLNKSFLDQFEEAAKLYSQQNRQLKLKEVLMYLNAVHGKQIQLSVRKSTNTRTEAYALSGFPLEAQQNLLLAPLSQEAYAQAFSEEPDKVMSYFHAATEVKAAALDGAVNFPVPGSAIGQAQFRTDLLTRYLVAGFVNPEDTSSNVGPAPLGPDEKNKTKMYGVGYQISFGQSVSPFGFPGYPARVIANVTERNLESGVVAGGIWDCRLRFKIVRPEDREKTFYFDSGSGTPAQAYACPVETWDQLNTEYNLGVLHLLRRVLPAEWWDINVSQGCVVPKPGVNACYDSSNSQPIVYDEYFFPVGQADATQGKYTSCGEEGQYPCAHYLTVCIRR